MLFCVTFDEMLPSKGYFSSLECPFFLSSTHCSRPYCHYKHPKRSPNAEVSQLKVDDGSNDHVGCSLSDTVPTPVEEKPSALVKHIPIAYIPTKPSGVSVNIKKPKNVCMYVPTAKNEGKSSLMGSVDYHPSSVMDSSEKTYSRYSYEKGHDSGDEIMENHKNLIETNKICKFDDNSKSGYDEEIDDYLDEPVFSPVNSENEDVPDEQIDNSELFSKIHSESSMLPKGKDVDSSNKRKYSENNETNPISIKIKTENEENDVSDIISVKRIKTEEKVNNTSKKIKSEKSSSEKSSSNSLSKSSTKYEESSSHQSKKDEKETKHVDSKHCSKSHKISGNKKKEHTDHKKSLPNTKTSSKSSHKSNASSSDSKKPHSEKKLLDTKKISSENNKKHSSSGKDTSKVKKHSSDRDKKAKKESSSSSNKSSDSKKHSSDKTLKKTDKHSSESKAHSSESKTHSSESKTHSSEIKTHSSSNNKKEREKVKSSSKNKETSKPSEGKHSDKKKEHCSSKKPSKCDNKYNRRKSDHSRSDDRGKCKKRKHSDSSCSLSSVSEPKETILISDSSDCEETKVMSINSYSPVGVDDIFGSSDSGDDDKSAVINNHEISDSASDDEYSPLPLRGSKQSPIYNPSLSVRKKVEDSEIMQHFKTAPQSSTEDYKPSQSAAKVRIAHVPNVSSLLSAKNLISSGKTVPPVVQKLVTSMEVIKSKIPYKSQSHIASNNRPKPQVSLNLNSVIALNIRQPGLNNIYDEFIKYVDYEEAYQRAIQEENEICNVATNPQSYRNRIALCILRIRKSKGAVDVVQMERITSNSVPDYTYGLTLYECFSKYLLEPQDYVLHGYPMELPGKPGCAYIDKNSYFRSKRVEPLEGPFRKCVNCGKEYAADEETGIPLTKNNCHHHWGKLIGMRQGKIYSCCKSEVGSDPCHTAIYHVTELKNEDCLEGFVKTKPYPSNADPLKAGIYAMDCEMCYTTQGRDIVRASLLAVDNESVYDVLIKPKYPILDYCTRFSGITEEKLENVTTTLEDVQRFLLKTINDKTILVGHSLENDLKALKLLHYNVVDTSIMFPHKEGFPVKCALRTLCSRILGTAIQTGENGHDSLEDARACLQLVIHQVREDAKARKPRVVKQLKTTK